MDNKNLIITISRQHGVDARYIIRLLSEKMGIPFYDNVEMSKQIENEEEAEYFRDAGETESSEKTYREFEHPYLKFTSLNDKMFADETRMMRDFAKDKSAIFMGRCCDDILSDHENLLRVFIYAPLDRRMKVIMEREKIEVQEALRRIRMVEHSRQVYYENYTEKTWGAPDNYDLCINYDKMTPEMVAEMIKAAAEAMMASKK